jgi:hypothetical protein
MNQPIASSASPRSYTRTSSIVSAKYISSLGSPERPMKRIAPTNALS